MYKKFWVQLGTFLQGVILSHLVWINQFFTKLINLLNSPICKTAQLTYKTLTNISVRLDQLKSPLSSKVHQRLNLNSSRQTDTKSFNNWNFLTQISSNWWIDSLVWITSHKFWITNWNTMAPTTNRLKMNQISTAVDIHKLIILLICSHLKWKNLFLRSLLLNSNKPEVQVSISNPSDLRCHYLLLINI